MAMSIVIVGNLGVGKTALLCKFAEKEYDPCIDVFYKTFKVNGILIRAEIKDTVGGERFRSMPDGIYLGAVGALLVYNTTDHETFEFLDYWLEELHHICPNIVTMLTGNNCNPLKLKEVCFEEAKEYADRNKLLFVETSLQDCSSFDEHLYELLSEIYQVQTGTVVTRKGILLKSVNGTKVNEVSIASRVKAFLSLTSTVAVPCGEIVIEAKNEGLPYNFSAQYNDQQLFMVCKKSEVAILGVKQLTLLEAIEDPADRIQIFNNKLKWGLNLHPGSRVLVMLPKTRNEQAAAVVRYCGIVANHHNSGCGILFGIEILESKYRTGKYGSNDGKPYFICENGCGLFASLDSLSPVTPSWKEDSESSQDLSLEDLNPVTAVVKACDKMKTSSDLPETSGNAVLLPRSSNTPSQGEKCDESSNVASCLDLATARNSPMASVSVNSQFFLQTSQPLSMGPDPFPSSIQSELTSTLHQRVEVSETDILTEEQPSVNALIEQIKSLKVALKSAEDQQRKMEEQSCQKQQETEELNKKININLYLLHEKRSEIEHLRQAIELLENEVVMLKKKAAGEQQQLKAQIDSLISIIEEKENIIWTKEDLIRAQCAEILAKTDEIATKNDEIAAKNDDIAAKGDEIAALQQQLDAELNFALMEIQHSSKASWSITRDEVQSLTKKQIGSGAWGIVYSAKFRGEDVAIKQAHQQLFHQTTVDMVRREIMIMAHIQHPNLVRFIAAVLDTAVEEGLDTPIIISELMDMNLREAYTRVDLRSTLHSILCDVAYALHYLHQRRPSIIHRDVSAPNILLKTLPYGGYRAKVSDFGSANLVKYSKTAGAGAIVYCAPEMFPNEDISVRPQPQTTKVDIFSYGILLLEVIVREMPTPESRFDILQRVRAQSTTAYELIIQCTKPLPSERPTMSDILNTLNFNSNLFV